MHVCALLQTRKHAHNCYAVSAQRACMCACSVFNIPTLYQPMQVGQGTQTEKEHTVLNYKTIIPFFHIQTHKNVLL